MSLNQWARYHGSHGGRTHHHSAGIFGASALFMASTAVTSAAWPSANEAVYIPITVERFTVVAQIWWLNGGTASGNVDCGLYTEEGTLLTSSGSTAQTGTSVLQAVNVTDLTIGPGLYYIALVLDNTTGTVGSQSAATVELNRMNGVLQQATAFPLPATATFAANTRTRMPGCGFVSKATL